MGKKTQYPPGAQGDPLDDPPDPRKNPKAWTAGGGYLPPEFDPRFADYQEPPPPKARPAKPSHNSKRQPEGTAKRNTK
jgi:hypothetical protein